MLRRSLAVLALVMVVLVGLQAWGDTLTLKNGQVIEGVVIDSGSTYWVRLPDGTSQRISKADVKSVVKGNAPSSPSPGISVGETASASSSAGATVSFSTTRQRADAVEAPILAVTIWEKYIDANPTSPDLPAAKVELEKWQKLQKDNAEKIKGKWVGGEDRKKLLKEVARLCEEAREQLESQELQAIEKYQKVLAMYPNSFEANFAMGYYHLRKGAYGSTGRGNKVELDKAVKALETAVKLNPGSPETLSNLGLGYAFKERWEDAVLMSHKAVKIEDNQRLAENFVNILVAAPQGMKTNNRRIRPVIEEAVIIAQKYGIPATGNRRFHYLAPKPPGMDKKGPDGEEEEGPPGIVGNGSGFLISADGYLITNRHVAEGKNRLFRVRFDDGTEKAADVIAIDTKFDIALMKIKADNPLPYLKIASADLPNPASKCMVLGYPVGHVLNYIMQVTSGEITSTDVDDEYQVTLTANTTRGNSGGPIVDRDCNVIGVLSAGIEVYNATYVKALSAGQIRGFLARCKDKYPTTIEPGKSTDTPFDGEKLALEARKATLLVLVIRGEGRETISDIVKVGDDEGGAE